MSHGQTVPDLDHLDLNAARAFVHLARANSFRAAGRQLGMSKSSVSRKVAALEKQLGAQLIHRTTRTFALTEAGVAFVEHIERALPHIASAENAVSQLQREPRGRLRVTAAVKAGQLFLGTVVPEFLAEYPAVEVSVHLTDRYVDIVKERFDIALRTGKLEDSALIARQVGSSHFRLVASPHYLQEHGTPTTPADLGDHSCLLYSKADQPNRPSWPLGKTKRARNVRVTGRYTANDLDLIHDAAVAGLGIARLPSAFVRRSIGTRVLVPLLDAYAPAATPLYLVRAEGHLLPRTRAFLDFLQPRIAKEFERAQLEESSG